METVLKIKNLRTMFKYQNKEITALRGVSLDVKKGRTLVILGESGSGKSVLLKSILRLLDEQKTAFSGEVKYDDMNLLNLTEREMAKVRGEKIVMIYQNALTALDPVFKVGSQIKEVIEKVKLTKNEKWNHVIQSLRGVGIPSAEERIKSYPHELSGGMRQRAVIAMALIKSPDILLADEPTTALDVTIQSQILYLFKKVQEQHGTTLILVTHDIGVAAAMADDIAVMYAGNIVESGTVEEVLFSPQHPYTKGLIDATPQGGQKRKKLIPIPGEPPSLFEITNGCAFAPRCFYSSERCHEVPPELLNIDSSSVYCHHPISSMK